MSVPSLAFRFVFLTFLKMKSLFVDIALPVPLEKTFTYVVPPELQAAASPGCRALVPFGRKYAVGIIVKVSRKTSVPNLKPISDILDSQPTFSEELLKLTKWIAEYYFAPWGEVLKAASPRGFAAESRRVVQLVHTTTRTNSMELVPKKDRISSRQKAVMSLLSKGGALSIRYLQKKLRTKSIYALLNRMAAAGLVKIEEELPLAKRKSRIEKFVKLGPGARNGSREEVLEEIKGKKQQEILEKLFSHSKEDQEPILVSSLLKECHASLSSLVSLERKGFVEIEKREVPRRVEFKYSEPKQKFALNYHQVSALQQILKPITSHTYQTFLLHGVTGSGKTQIYIEAIDEVLQRDRTAIVLVPEISLTPQMVYRFRSRFGEKVAVFHSRMSPAERYDAWRLARVGTYKIVIGPRSAIFAPLNDLGLIVVDEEQEATYKQFDASPRYNARDVAIIRGTYNNAVVLLGSATPSVESYYNAR